MAAVSIILGIILTICGISCTFTPLATFMGLVYVIMILFIFYGIMGIAGAISAKQYGINFIFSILSVLAGLALACVPQLRILTNGMLLYTLACWMIVQGAITIYLAFKMKKITTSKRWIFGLILGIIGILLGIFSFAHPLALAWAEGITIGVYLMVSGINMVIVGANNT